MNPLDLLSGAMDVLDMPGSYTRGLLAGRPGERASGDELLGAWGFNPEGLGGAAGFATELATDPLNLLTGGAAAAVSPIARGVGRGTLAQMGRMANPKNVYAGSIPLPIATELRNTMDNPIGRLAAQTKMLDPLTGGASFSIAQPLQKKLYNYPSPRYDAYAMFREPEKVIVPNLNVDEWASDDFMRNLVEYRMKGNVPAGVGTAPDYIGIHELGHALHQPILASLAKAQGLTSGDPVGRMKGPWLKSLSSGDVDRIAGNLSMNALKDPYELVAEGFSRKVLTEKPLPDFLENLYQTFHGPSIENLPAEFWRSIVR